MSEIPLPDKLWDLIDADHAFRDALEPGGLDHYGELARDLLAAAWVNDADGIDEIINDRRHGELQILVVCLAFTTVEWVRRVANVMSVDDLAMLYDLLQEAGDGDSN